MNELKSLCVFCGSNVGKRNEYVDTAKALGRIMANDQIRLIFGAGQVGLMGVIADAVLQNGGEAVGVIPEFLCVKEVVHPTLTELIVTETMHQRKQKMERLSDGFIAMPGGYGTLEELAEIITWLQLGLHSKPVGLLNMQGYYDPLLSMADMMHREGFLSADNRNLLLDDSSPKGLLEKMRNFRSPDRKQWLERSRT